MPNPDPVPTVSIVIVSYNTKELTAKCVRSIIEDCRDIATEIIVVDNASPDGSADYLEQAFPSIQLIRSGGSFGFSFANNLGFAASRSQFILCLNPDTVMNADALRIPLEYLARHPDTAMAGIRLIDGTGMEECSAMRFLRPVHFMMLALLPKSLVMRMPAVGDTRYGSHDPATTFACDAIVGCFMLFPRWLIEQVGGFDDRFFMYGEEVEWCWRVRKAGYGIVYIGGCAVIHYDGASTKTMSKWKLTMMTRGHILSQTLMHGRLAGKIVNAWMIVGQCLRMPIWIGQYAVGQREPLINNAAKLGFLTSALFRPVSHLFRDKTA